MSKKGVAERDVPERHRRQKMNGEPTIRQIKEQAGAGL